MTKMKNFLKSSYIITFCFILSAAFGIASCLGDDDLPPTGAESVFGIYEGRMTMGLPQGDTTINVQVQVDRNIAIAPMAMHLMMDSIIALDTASSSYNDLKKITYYSAYTAKEELGTVTFDIPAAASDLYVVAPPVDPDHVVGADKTPHTVRLTIMADGPCSYTPTDGLTLHLKATNAKLDGVRAPKFRPIPLTIEHARLLDY